MPDTAPDDRPVVHVSGWGVAVRLGVVLSIVSGLAAVTPSRRNRASGSSPVSVEVMVSIL